MTFFRLFDFSYNTKYTFFFDINISMLLFLTLFFLLSLLLLCVILVWYRGKRRWQLINEDDVMQIPMVSVKRHTSTPYPYISLVLSSSSLLLNGKKKTKNICNQKHHHHYHLYIIGNVVVIVIHIIIFFLVQSHGHHYMLLYHTRFENFSRKVETFFYTTYLIW